MRVKDPTSGVSIDLSGAGGTFCVTRPADENAPCAPEISEFLDEVAPRRAWAAAYVDTGKAGFAVLGNTLSMTGTRASKESLGEYVRDWVEIMNSHIGPSTNITPGGYVALHDLDAPAIYFDMRLNDPGNPMLWRTYTVFTEGHAATITLRTTPDSDGPFQEAAKALALSIEAPTTPADGFDEPSFRPEHLLGRPIVWAGAAILLVTIYRVVVMLRERRQKAR